MLVLLLLQLLPLLLFTTTVDVFVVVDLCVVSCWLVVAAVADAVVCKTAFGRWLAGAVESCCKLLSVVAGVELLLYRRVGVVVLIAVACCCCCGCCCCCCR